MATVIAADPSRLAPDDEGVVKREHLRMTECKL